MLGVQRVDRLVSGVVGRVIDAEAGRVGEEDVDVLDGTVEERVANGAAGNVRRRGDLSQRGD